MSAPFEEGPTPWTDAHADELAYDEEEVNFDMIRRLQRLCRAAEALLQKARDSVAAKPLQNQIDAHLAAREEMDQ